ncbi:MAG: HAD family hydrolase [Candidatus Aenigmarchaeota archaeon]|nr:HAD family hydrolase [Candidatus Aenigmarchaeota archaeon]
MKAIAFDKDGVLVDSLREIFHEAVAAYGTVAESKKNLEKFRSLYPFAKKAEDIYAVMKLIEGNEEIHGVTSLGAYDTSKAALFKKAFYASRHSLIAHSYKRWLSMIQPFSFAIRACNQLSRSHVVYISTASDKEGTLAQVKAYAIAVPESRILSKELSPDKEKHFSHIARTLKIKMPDILFIDNNLDQLDIAASTGVEPALASWGSNNFQVKEARTRGIPVLTAAGLTKQIRDLL